METQNHVWLDESSEFYSHMIISARADLFILLLSTPSVPKHSVDILKPEDLFMRLIDSKKYSQVRKEDLATIAVQSFHSFYKEFKHDDI